MSWRGRVGVAWASLALVGCFNGSLLGPRITGTCDGACAHYIECKPGHPEADRRACLAECPEVFSDPNSLSEYERLSCENAVEYVIGVPGQATPKTAAHR